VIHNTKLEVYRHKFVTYYPQADTSNWTFHIHQGE